MKLRRLEIKNFRGITDLNLELGDTTVLIGENNTGKTAILDALRFALREVRSRKGCAFDAYDFHLVDAAAKSADASPISIRLTFKEDVPGEWPNKLVADLNRSRIAQIDTTGCTTVILTVGARFDLNTQDFVQNWQFENINGSPLTSIADTAMAALQGAVAYYYLAALRDAAKHFDAKGTFWRPFLKESQLTQAKRIEIEGKLNEVNQLIVTSHASFATVAQKLKEVKDVVAVTGSEDLVSIDAVPGRLFDMLSKAQVNMNTGTGAKMPIGRHGEGTQSLSVLMLFNAFLQTWSAGSPIIALEEPEAHLHPSAIRSLWRLIDQIPGQKIITTHSGDILSEVPADSIVRLHKPTGVVTATHLDTVQLDQDDKRMFNYHIRRDRGELLFARCWILGEGETEATIVPEAARALGKNLEQSGVRVVTYRHSNLELYLKVAQSLGIHWVVLADNDQQGVRDQDKAKEYLNGRPEADSIFVMPEANIEQHLCTKGFVGLYYSLLAAQPRALVTVGANDPGYAIQVATALPKGQKTRAAEHVAVAMRTGSHAVPQLIQDVIEGALKLAS